MARARTVCGVAYVTALAVALGVGAQLDGVHPLVVVALADIAATLVVFGFSVAFGNSSLYDPYWSVAPIIIAGWWVLASGFDPRALIAALLILWWGLRLTLNFLRGWPDLTHEDWRYQNLRGQSGAFWPLLNLFGIHLLPTAWVYLGCLALYPIATSNAPFGWLDGIAVAVTALAIALEAGADRQLHAFRHAHPEGGILASGLWAWCRHPNYLGEMGFWWGLWLLGLAADAGAWWTIVGPISITLLFVGISIPMIDRRHVARRPGYAAHMRAVPSLIPRPPRV
ncbi:MAG: DUF1295 domain-containing protein [Gammaproteobacteria bacterium]